MSISIRQATEDDFEPIYNLIRKFSEFIGTPEKVSVNVEKMKKDKDIFKCLVAVDGDKVIGFATYFFTYYSWSGKALYLDDLYVIDAYRGRGIGTKLMDAITDMAVTSACVKLKWQVSRWNNKAIEFYKKRGAEIDEVEINCDLKLS
jgi:GNAT superfamily N-acetyltransferase